MATLEFTYCGHEDGRHLMHILDLDKQGARKWLRGAVRYYQIWRDERGQVCAQRETEPGEEPAEVRVIGFHDGRPVSCTCPQGFRATCLHRRLVEEFLAGRQEQRLAA